MLPFSSLVYSIQLITLTSVAPDTSRFGQIQTPNARIHSRMHLQVTEFADPIHSISKFQSLSQTYI